MIYSLNMLMVAGFQARSLLTWCQDEIFRFVVNKIVLMFTLSDEFGMMTVFLVVSG